MLLFTDTNVLISATDISSATHEQALFALEELPSYGVALYTCTQVLREYLVVATRPLAANGLGLGQKAALDNLEEFTRVIHVLPETLKTWEKTKSLIAAVNASGKRIHDVSLIACALSNGIENILTNNTTDFSQLPIKPVPLKTVRDMAQQQ
ncbi:MAG: type II toxin-antitoxin system VapC family toxin [Propionibacteriaceae bacterium]|jgi:predicted nucleic acid-binding protein|nr:type II toxin-antitoxin system VapC family toxin [Propionibacteriaceae bacterium]